MMEPSSNPYAAPADGGGPQTDPERCYRCGGTRTVEGKSYTIAQLYFRPNKLRTWSLTGYTPIASRACLDCGAVEHFVDPEALRRMTGDK